MNAYLAGNRRIISVLFAVTLISAGCLFSSGLYIHVKALLAQYLLERSWQRGANDESGEATPPWPWADTFPVAKIIVPRLDWRGIVLHGTSGEALAFGPGHMTNTAMPGEFGNSVIAGHRDTHFKVLASVEIGDEIIIQRRAGQVTRYWITELSITDEHDFSPADAVQAVALTLVTCYPFHASTPGGPLRYVVRAVANRPRPVNVKAI